MPLPGISHVTLAQLTLGPSMDSRTISLWLQIAFSAGSYAVGGIPAGVQLLAGQLSVDDTQFLQATIQGEATVVLGGGSYPTVGGYFYKYIPTTDKIQIFNTENGLELQESEGITPGILNDILVGEFIYVRL